MDDSGSLSYSFQFLSVWITEDNFRKIQMEKSFLYLIVPSSTYKYYRKEERDTLNVALWPKEIKNNCGNTRLIR